MFGLKKAVHDNVPSKELSILLVIITAVVCFFLFQDALARFVWNKYRLPTIVSSLMRNDAKLSLELGNYYFNVYGDGVYDLYRAEKYFEKALAIDPNAEDAWHQLARIEFLQGDFFDALEKINKQLELHGDSLMASYYIRGLINGYSRKFDDAEKDFLKFLSWDNENWAVHNDLAWIYFSQGRYEKVEEIARRGLQFNDNNPWLLNSLGVALLNLGKKGEAYDILVKAQNQAALLSDDDWNKAYPGNNPISAPPGLTKMKEAIEANVGLASKESGTKN